MLVAEGVELVVLFDVGLRVECYLVGHTWHSASLRWLSQGVGMLHC